MFWSLTLLTYALGVTAGWLAVRTHLRRRHATTAVNRRGRAASVVFTALAVIGLFVPESTALILLGDGVNPASVDALGWLRGLAAVSTLWVLVALAVTSRPAVAAVRGVADRGAARLPSVDGMRARRRFQRRLAGAAPELAEFPSSWPELLEFDQRLSRRLLSYEHDLERSVSHPSMRDYGDPHTRAALDAMFECDRLRTSAAPALTRDVITTGYGAAVARFAELLATAERHSVQRVRSGLEARESAAVAEAADILQFVQTHSTTAPEREDAYRAVRNLLAGQPSADSPTPTAQAGAPDAGAAHRTDPGDGDLDLGPATRPGPGADPHPWLDVRRRASLDRS